MMIPFGNGQLLTLANVHTKVKPSTAPKHVPRKRLVLIIRLARAKVAISSLMLKTLSHAPATLKRINGPRLLIFINEQDIQEPDETDLVEALQSEIRRALEQDDTTSPTCSSSH